MSVTAAPTTTMGAAVVEAAEHSRRSIRKYRHVQQLTLVNSDFQSYRSIIRKHALTSAVFLERSVADVRARGCCQQQMKQLTRLYEGAGTSAFFAAARTHTRAEVLLKRLAGTLLHQFDAAALVGTHDMHLLDTEMLAQLVGAAGAAPLPPGASLLDVGAGSGAITARIAPLFSKTTVMEKSWACAWRLQRSGFANVVRNATLDALIAKGELFDCVTMFNLLDRTTNPREMLCDAKALLRRCDGEGGGGILLVALALPLEHFVVGSAGVAALTEQLLPPERLASLPPRDGDVDAHWAATVEALSVDLFAPLGLETVALARTPYYCQGHKADEFWTLDDAIFVLRAEDGGL